MREEITNKAYADKVEALIAHHTQHAKEPVKAPEEAPSVDYLGGVFCCGGSRGGGSEGDAEVPDLTTLGGDTNRKGTTENEFEFSKFLSYDEAVFVIYPGFVSSKISECCGQV